MAKKKSWFSLTWEQKQERIRNAKRIEELEHYDRTRYILAMILGVIKPNTTIETRSSSGYRDNDLLDQLSRILHEERENPLIRKNFKFDERMTNPYCKEVKEYLGAFHNFGAYVGLRNWGLDFNFEVTQETMDIAKEGERLFNPEEIEFLKGLGRKIVEKK